MATIKEMHYDFKQKLNAVDSAKYTGYRIQEIDWHLNSAMQTFIKAIAMPRSGNGGLEFNQRTIDDLRTIVVDGDPTGRVATVVQADTSVYLAPLPANYLYHAGGSTVTATKGTCTQLLDVQIQQHDDRFKNPFNKGSFEWREIPVWYSELGIKLFTDGTFTLTNLYLNYIRKPLYMHNAAGVPGGTYTALDGTVYTGTQNCELPTTVHEDIVDLAVLMVSGYTSNPVYQAMAAKIKLDD